MVLDRLSDRFNRFQKHIIEWATKVDRDMPWQGSKDPYQVWLSEIILQQTRVEQGRGYYLRFLDTFPTVIDLANAEEDKVLSLWQGLGYYSRARNLHASAKMIRDDFDGVFPNSYDSIIKLKGVGDYTASAISSFVYNEPKAVLDGNVFRVLSRFENISIPIDSTQGKKLFKDLAQQYLSEKHPATYNQGIMNFGAVQCKPVPLCDTCELKEGCQAHTKGTQTELPFKAKKLKRKKRYFNYLVADVSKGIYLKKRSQKDIWQGLYEPYLIESAEQLDNEQLLEKAKVQLITSQPLITKQILSHQEIYASFWRIKDIAVLEEGCQFYSEEELSSIGVPKIVDWYLKNKSVYLI